MNLLKSIVASSLAMAIILGYNQNLMSWDLTSLIPGSLPDEIRLDVLENLDPDRDLPSLPSLEGKTIFKAVEDLSILRNDEVRNYIIIYLTRGRPYVKRSMENAVYYLPVIQHVMSRHEGIPGDIALLPLLESGFQPKAVSRSGAVGLWQFMYRTGKGLGLKVTRHVDERRHTEKATDAAMRHLAGLYKIFDSWELALAAYNGGGGHVYRALKRSGEKDFWKLIKTRHLRKETREYVPRFLAMLTIYHHAALFGIKDELNIPQVEETVTVTLDYTVSLSSIARTTGIPLEVIRNYNPHIKGGITPPCALNHGLRIPAQYLEQYSEAHQKLFRLEVTRLKPYRVKRGDTLMTIARRHKKKLLSS